VANTATLKSVTPNRLTYLISGDGSSTSLVLASATLLAAALAGPLKNILSGSYGSQAAMRTAMTEGPVKVWTRKAVSAFVQPTAQSSAVVATANANTQTSSYVQADAQSVATLANALKTQLNLAIADITALYNSLASQDTITVDVQPDGTTATAPAIVLTMPAKTGAQFYLDIQFGHSIND
jgi:hypothetical protein